MVFSLSLRSPELGNVSIMRVLVPNGRNQQSYSTIVGLRSFAEHIVVAAHGRRPLTYLFAPAYRSRFVDARYHVPPPPKAGATSHGAASEDRYVDALLNICRREALDLVIPSCDDVTYTISRQKARFMAAGVTVAAPDFDVVSRTMDKANVMREAEAAGIPIPRTFVPQTLREAEEFIAAIGLPAVLKPAFDAGGHQLHWLLRRSDLSRYWRAPTNGGPSVLLQEFIPGPVSPGTFGAFTVIDRAGQVKAMFTHQRLRYARWHICMPHAASVSTTDPVLRDQTTRLLRALGYWGAACVEWKRDPRDGQLKLLEPNARMGAPSWPALAAGVNIPHALAHVARDNDFAPMIDDRDGWFYVDPVIEGVAMATFLVHGLAALLRKPPSPTIDSVPSLESWRRDLIRTYRSGRVVPSDMWRALLTDPLPGLLFWLDQLLYVGLHARDFLPVR